MSPAGYRGCYHGVFMKRLSMLLLIAPLAASCQKASQTPPAAQTGPAAAQPAGQGPGGAPVAATAAPAKPMPAQIPAVLARVNGEAVEKWEFDQALKGVEARAGGPVPAERRDEVLRGVLDQLVSFHLLAQESRARKLEIPESDVDQQIAQMKGGFPSEEAFTQGLAQQGLTLEQLKNQTRTRMQVAKIIETEVASKVSVQDAEVDAFYKENTERFKQDESVHASHILIALPQNATPEQKAAAKASAQAALRKVRGGADFAALAKTTSNDASAQNGGDLGFVPRGRTVPAFEEAAFALKPGAVSGVVETQFGFHVIKAHEKRAARTAPFAEVSGQIKQFLMQGQQEKRLEQFVQEARAKAKIEMLV
jgi:peptidyl-prolyl cis-trans isomerase C